MGPRTLPCGTPLKTAFHVDSRSLMTKESIWSDGALSLPGHLADSCCIFGARDDDDDDDDDVVVVVVVVDNDDDALLIALVRLIVLCLFCLCTVSYFLFVVGLANP